MISSKSSTTVALGSLGEVLGLRLRRAHGAVRRHFSEKFASLALTQKQVSVLWLVGEHPDIAQTELASSLDIDRATVMTLVHALEKRGLLSRRESQGDARRVALRLTETGTATLADAKAAIAEHEAWLKGRYSKSELTVFEEMLDRIVVAG